MKFIHPFFTLKNVLLLFFEFYIMVDFYSIKNLKKKKKKKKKKKSLYFDLVIST
jgi:hypothetical protein